MLLLLFLLSVHARAEGPNCSKWTAADFDKYFRTKMLVHETLPPCPPDKKGDACTQFMLDNSPLDVEYKIKLFRASCAQRIRDLKLDACVERIYSFRDQFENRNNHMYSTHLTDSQYEKYLEQTVPGLMELPAELKSADYALPENWREIAENKGWKWALFPSNLLQQRLVILLPDQLEKGRGTDFRRMLVYYKDNDGTCDIKKPKGVQMQAVEQKESSADSLPDYFFQSWRFENPDKKAHVKAYGGRCVTCHTGGPRTIEPFVENELIKTDCKIEVGGVKNVEELNKLMVAKGRLDFGPYYDMKHFPEKLRVGPKECVSCHNGDKRQSLIFAINRDGSPNEQILRHKIEAEKTMPPFDGKELTDSKRTELKEAVRTDFYNQLAKWMTEKKCDALPKAAADPLAPKREIDAER